MRLAEYLAREGLTHRQFAARLRASQASVSRYAAGERFPEPRMLALIEEETGGKVTADDFMRQWKRSA